MEDNLSNVHRLEEIAENMWILKLAAFVIIFLVVKYTLDQALKERN